MKIVQLMFVSSAIALGFAGGALAQERMAPVVIPDASHPAAAMSPSAAKGGSAAAAHSSFTMSEAKAHIEKAGYTNVADLAKNEDGLWRGQAMSHGRHVGVSVDYQGHVAAR